MDPAFWKRIEAAFHRAKALAPEAREGLLVSLGDEDAELALEVKKLLAADRLSSQMLGGILETAASEALDRLPEAIGPYPVISRIGTGGFSSVYLARGEGGSSERVAVKVLRKGFASPDLRQRLLQEGQILARLHHPAIARLLGTGTTSEGEPYFVMEYVDGEPIDRYCDARGLSIRERLKLFRQVCSAVDFAHRNLVIHRDLKPSNLLVTRTGAPKLLDFGIAKLLRPELIRDATLQTTVGGSLMTPEFASPEQVREEPLTTATDVYSLGVLLYRLLCGRAPYRFPSRSPLAIERVVSGAQPPPPSLAVSARAASESERTPTDTTPEEAASFRGATVKQLRSQLSGDLDSIVLTALGPRPEGRYSSAEQLSLDLGRYLSSEPVKARRVTPFYRATKFVQRHRVGVGILVLVLTVLATAVVVTTRATFRAEAERARAEQHLAEAKEVSKFLIDVFQVPDPERAQGKDFSAKELLDEGETRIRNQLKDQPELRSVLMMTMAKVYRNLGDHQTSRELLEEVLAQRRSRLAPTDPRVIEARQELARTRMIQGDQDQALELLQAARSDQEASGCTSTLEYAETLDLLAETNKELNRLQEAEALYRRALELRRGALEPDDPAVINNLIGLAELFGVAKDLDKAEEAFREALSLRRSRPGDLHPDLATNLSDLAFVLHGQGELEEAETAIREAVRIRSALYGEDHWIVEKSFNNLGQILLAQGRLDEALPLMEKALEISRTHLGVNHPQVAARSVNLALAYKKAGRIDQAEALLLKALEIHLRVFGEDHPSTARNLHNLAGLYADTGRGDEALPLLDRVVRILETSLPENDYRLAHPLYLRGHLLIDAGDCPKAIPSLKAALRLRREKYSKDHPKVERVQAQLDRCGG